MGAEITFLFVKVKYNNAKNFDEKPACFRPIADFGTISLFLNFSALLNCLNLI